MSPKDREPYLSAIDSALSPAGFRRPKASFEWKHRAASGNVEWVHLNFGLGVINPSFGVRFEDLASILPKDAGAQTSVAEMLEPISGKSYTIDMAPSLLSADVVTVALPELVRLNDRASVIDRLLSMNARDWPTISASARIRLLPLLLAASGRIDVALEWVRQFEADADRIDQRIPAYPVYAAYFRARYTA